MSFMKPETYEGDYWEVDGPCGIVFIPADVAGRLDSWPSDNSVDEESDLFAEAAALLGDYLDSSEIWSIEYHSSGTLYRLSASGYMDCTDWSTEPETCPTCCEEYDDNGDCSCDRDEGEAE